MPGTTWQGRKLVQAWVTPSSSSNAEYRTARWDDGTLSCDCPAWRMKKAGQERDCKHLRQVREFGVTLDGGQPVAQGVWARPSTAPSVTPKKGKPMLMQPASKAVMDEIQARSAFLEIP